MTPQQHIRALADNPKDIIRRYDIDYDRPFKHHHALGVLELADAYEDKGALGVGAAWCRMVYFDVHYRSAEGLTTLHRSSKLAERLTERLLHATTADPFDAYAAA